MIKIEVGGFNLLCEGEDDNLTVKGFEGMDGSLDLSGYDSIRAIDRKAFLFCKSLKSVRLPKSIEHVGEWAFSKCSNLSCFGVNKDFEGNIFGRSVFEGCDSLESIEFLNSGEGLSRLHALSANMLSNDHLLRGEDLGEKTWYEKWDICLLSYLSSDGKEADINAVVCGEEDISYDGLGSIDGEMSAQTGDHVTKLAKDKCILCFKRLRYDDNLSKDTREKIYEYIRRRAFGEENPYAWLALKEDCAGDEVFYDIYLDIAAPGKDTIEKMIEDLNSTQVQLKAFLIEKASKKGENSFFESLFL